MKTKFTLFMLLACASVNAQNIVSVQMKDGTTHNYSLEDFSKISFTDGEPTDFYEMYGQTGDKDVLVLTFEDKDFKGGIDNYWTSLVDETENMGPLLYDNGASYWFCDDGNTDLLYEGFIDSGYGAAFWSGGYAISNYWNETYDDISMDRQLTVSTTKNPGPGADGSDNFMIVYSWRSALEDANSGFSATKPLYIDGADFEPQYVYATNTSYVLNSLHNGGGAAVPATENSWFKLYAEGVKADGEKVYTSINLCTGTDIEQEWVKFDLTPLGRVKELYFFVMGSDDLCGDFGLNTPGYAAVDNIAIKK